MNENNNELLKARVSDAKYYWRILRGNVSAKHSHITVHEFKDHFTSMLTPEYIFHQADNDIISY